MGGSEHFSHDALVTAIPNLRAFAIALCHDATLADDLVQDTLVKAWNGRHRFEDGTNLKAWLFTILRNTYFSEHRRRKHQAAYLDAARTRTQYGPPEQYGHLDLQDFMRALSQLAPDQRESLLLVGAEGFSYEEAAEISGCAIGTIKSRVNRARRRLSELLHISAGDEFGPDPLLESIVSRAASVGKR